MHIHEMTLKFCTHLKHVLSGYKWLWMPKASWGEFSAKMWQMQALVSMGMNSFPKLCFVFLGIWGSCSTNEKTFIYRPLKLNTQFIIIHLLLNFSRLRFHKEWDRYLLLKIFIPFFQFGVLMTQVYKGPASEKVMTSVWLMVIISRGIYYFTEISQLHR